MKLILTSILSVLCVVSSANAVAIPKNRTPRETPISLSPDDLNRCLTWVDISKSTICNLWEHVPANRIPAHIKKFCGGIEYSGTFSPCANPEARKRYCAELYDYLDNVLEYCEFIILQGLSYEDLKRLYVEACSLECDPSIYHQ